VPFEFYCLFGDVYSEGAFESYSRYDAPYYTILHHTTPY
jgi:hypothetical protein